MVCNVWYGKVCVYNCCMIQTVINCMIPVRNRFHTSKYCKLTRGECAAVHQRQLPALALLRYQEIIDHPLEADGDTAADALDIESCRMAVPPS